MDWIYYTLQSTLLLLLVPVIQIVQTGQLREVNFHTRIGTFTGITRLVEFDGTYKNATYFLGIPYAKPPVGEKRFTRPEPFGQIKTLYNATYYRPHCIQTRSTYDYLKNYTQSEDCLYLNVYIPGNSKQNDMMYPVMIYIHGGSFVDGGSDVYDGDILSALHDVIIVTVNYRLNIFGFLSDGDNLKGNYGLWDMKLAIKWVHDNIKAFDGDPARVTLFGHSAGGAAVLYQAINPNNRGLFQRVIAQSGSCFAFWAIQRKPARNFRWFLSQVGCERGVYFENIKCLREIPAEYLKLAETEYTTQFVPSVDLDFLPEEPELLSQRQSQAGIAAMDFFSELYLLNGVTSKDGAFALGYWSAGMLQEDINADIETGVSEYYFKEKYIPEILSDMYDNIPRALVESTKHQYTDWSRPNDPLIVRDKLMEFESDVTFFVPAIFASRTHRTAQGSKVSNNSYFYVFDHKPDFAPEPLWLTGATHVMELPYIFGFPKLLQSKLIHDYDAVDPFRISQQDLKFSKVMMKFWTNFAKTGDPNIPVRSNDIDIPDWPSFETGSQQYLELTADMTSKSVKQHLAASRIAYWENLVPFLEKCHTNTSAGAFIFPAVSWLVEFIILFNLTKIE